MDTLLKVGEGITHEFQTDEIVKFQKDIPKGGQLVSIKKIGGKSIVWNQYCKIKNGDYGWSYKVIDEDKILDLSNSVIYIYYKTTVKSISDSTRDKYLRYLRFVFFNNDKQTETNIGFESLTSDQIKEGYTVITRERVSLTTGLSKIYGYNYGEFNKGIGARCDTTINIFNLTQMFGRGNEPTQEEFESMLNKEYYEYCEPTFIHNNNFNIEVQGQNLLDLNNYINYTFIYSQSNNSLALSSEYDYVKIFKFNVKSGEVYTFYSTILNNNLCAFGKNNNINNLNILGKCNQTKPTPFTVTVPEGYNNMYICFSIRAKGEYVYKYNYNEFKPYKKTVYEIPEAIRNLDGYGWGLSDTVYNYIDLETKTFHKKVGRVDLGTLKWSIVTSNKYKLFINSSLKGSNIYDNALITKYSHDESIREFINKNLYGNPDGIVISDDLYSNVNDFTESVKGVYLYYELTNEEIIDISDLIPEGFLEAIPVEENGTITFKSNIDVDINLPVPTTEEYLIKLENE